MSKVKKMRFKQRSVQMILFNQQTKRCLPNYRFNTSEMLQIRVFNRITTEYPDKESAYLG